MSTYTAISLFTGAGGMDVGFHRAGFNIVFANELNKEAAATYKTNFPDTELSIGSIDDQFENLTPYKNNIDVIFGGPPCQGFSVAGKMDLNDERNNLIFSYLKAVEIVNPKVFIMENVKALAKLEKWENIRNTFIKQAKQLGYTCKILVLNATDYGVPQKRERTFFIGYKGKVDLDFEKILHSLKQKPPTIKQLLSELPPVGTELHPLTCTAKITFALNPILRKSPYAGMLFNGAGRPIDLNGYANTLPASMGGNKTPIIDEKSLREDTQNWVEIYHTDIINKRIAPINGEAPDFLRRLTLKEAALIQTFPENYKFCGKDTAVYRQIGNAVPSLLAEKVAILTSHILSNQNLSLKDLDKTSFSEQLELLV